MSEVWVWHLWSNMVDWSDVVDPASGSDGRGGGRVFRILTVCTMNICRSPAMEVSLQGLALRCGPDGPKVQVGSAGTHATPGAPSCDISLAHVGCASREQTARELSGALLSGADLILTAERKHANAVASIDPSYAAICFPIRTAARLVTWVSSDGALDVAIRKAHGEEIERDFDSLSSFAAPLPHDSVERLRWLVDQCDGARGLAPMLTETKLPYGVEDIPDPHVLGFNLHEMSAGMITEAVTELGRAVERVLSVTVPE